jgi:hypothetical protein
MTQEEQRALAAKRSMEAQARAKRGNDAATVLQALIEAKRWHQGDCWRDGAPVQRAAWEDHMQLLNAAIDKANESPT